MSRNKPFGRKRAAETPCEACKADIGVYAKRVRGLCQKCYSAWWRASQICWSVTAGEVAARLPGRESASAAAKAGWAVRRQRNTLNSGAP